jgi:hypothetical protein
VSLIDAARSAFRPSPMDVPQDIELRQKRGRAAMLKDAPKRRLCMRFRRGDTYGYVNSKNTLSEQSTVTNPDGTGKPPHRIRNRYDFLGPIIDAKVSAATQRVPSYEINPSTGDPRQRGIAGLSTKVALYGYDKWRIRQGTLKIVDLAIGGGGVGYGLPYFDPDVGPYTQVDGKWIGRGEIKLLVLSGNQVYSETGVDFDDSPWYAIERARPIDEVRKIPGFITGLAMTPDARQSDIPTDRAEEGNSVMVTEYFERPSSTFPQGRCVISANGRVIVDYRQIDPTAEDFWGPYPLVNEKGEILDEPIIHRLVYRHDADSDTDLGLTWRLVDFERTAQDVYNKILEYKNRGLNLQMLAPINSLIGRPDDTPNGIRYYKETPLGGKPEWETGPPPQILQALLQILERTVSDMRDVAFDVNFQVAPNVAAQTVTTAVEQSSDKWQSFLGDLADWHSRVMRHCLLLVARHYTEPRLVSIRGRFGWENLTDFRGADLMGEVDVRVLPDSLTTRSRQQVQQELAWIQANWPGYLSPETAIAAIHGGSADKLIESYELDLARVNRVIQAILDGSVMDLPDREQTDPATGESQEVPSYMPSPNDALALWRKAFGDFLKTYEFEHLKPEMQTVAQQIWSGIEYLENAQAQRAAMQQQMQAQQLGEANAAAPQVKGVPSQPGVSAPAQLTP